MGCGKSSVGKKISELLCCRFMDLDTAIEEREGCSVAEIFASRGEAEFRRVEAETLKEIVVTGGRALVIPKTPALVTLGHPLAGGGMSSPSSSTPAAKSQQDFLPKNNPTLVLALGGGAVMTPECGKMVHEQTVCVYLRASVDELVARLSDEAAGRPLLSGTDSRRSSQTAVTSSEVETSTLRKRILELMSKRSSTYEQVAHLIIDTDGKSIEQVAAEISTMLPSMR